jgi:hypothetical protein
MKKPVHRASLLGDLLIAMTELEVSYAQTSKKVFEEIKDTNCAHAHKVEDCPFSDKRMATR